MSSKLIQSQVRGPAVLLLILLLGSCGPDFRDDVPSHCTLARLIGLDCNSCGLLRRLEWRACLRSGGPTLDSWVNAMGPLDPDSEELRQCYLEAGWHEFPIRVHVFPEDSTMSGLPAWWQADSSGSAATGFARDNDVVRIRRLDDRGMAFRVRLRDLPVNQWPVSPRQLSYREVVCPPTRQ